MSSEEDIKNALSKSNDIRIVYINSEESYYGEPFLFGKGN